MNKRTFKWVLFFVIGVIAVYPAYDLHLKFVINDYQISLIEKRLIKNFEEHSKELFELTELVKQSKEFELALPNENELALIIENIDYENYEQIATISIQDDFIMLYDTSLSLKDVEQVVSKSVLFDTLEVPDWSVNYSGPRNSQIATSLLNNRGINHTNLNLIVDILKKANCIGIIKTDNRTKIRFKGHRFDNFNYVYLTYPNEPTDLKELSENFYWEHYEFGLFCGWTNWGWI